MSEEDAFTSFCHVMFDLQIRNQYKPDMNAVQVSVFSKLTTVFYFELLPLLPLFIIFFA